MEPKQIYATEIKLGTEKQREELDAAVLEALWYRKGKSQRISRVDLIWQVFGVRVGKNQLANNKMDRQIRESIERLRQEYVILSSSGLDGYWFPECMAEVLNYLAEIESRACKLLQQKARMQRNAEAQFEPQMQEMLF